MTDEDVLPGISELGRRARWCILAAVLVIAAAGVTVTYWAISPNVDLEVARELQARENVDRWLRIRQQRARDVAVAKALRDSLEAFKRAAPAVARTIARADTAWRAIAIGRDTAAAIDGTDTTRYSSVTRAGDPRVYVAPAFLVETAELQRRALDSAVAQLMRANVVIALARVKMAKDSLDRIQTDSLIGGLQREAELNERAVGMAKRKGRLQGFVAGVVTTSTVGGLLLLAIVF